jgi:hypothetical protein
MADMDMNALLSSEIFVSYMKNMESNKNHYINEIEKLEQLINNDKDLKFKFAQIQDKLYKDAEYCKVLGPKAAKVVMALNIDNDEDFEDEDDFWADDESEEK